VDELILRLSDPRIELVDGQRRARATAQLVHEPAGPGQTPVESRRFGFTAPLGPIETADLQWYLERYYLWPVGVFQQRAAEIADRLPIWGRALFTAATGDREVFGAWARGANVQRRFSVLVDDAPPVDATPEGEAAAREAATKLLALPWELLHDGTSWLFQGRNAVRVRRRLPNRAARGVRQTRLPIRILLVSPRPERSATGDPVGYLDHRASAQPLVEAVESLGERARLTVLQPPTYAALEQALRDASDRGEPFDVVHFDGHGTYDRRLGLGGLCFEQPEDGSSRAGRTLEVVDATKLAGLVREHRIPLVFLDACQTALATTAPTASVVAMTHSVLVDTTRRFVEAFYADLARGSLVGAAMLAGQRALFADERRGKVLGAGDLRLQDWFVPVLYQERQDPQPITSLPAAEVDRLAAKARTLRLGALPEPPEHHFQGRSRELLALERHLHRRQWAVVRGTGGQGKTTLAVELARWLVRTHRAQRAVFVSLEHHRDPRAVLDAIGRQLVPGYSVAEYSTLDEARQPVERALTDRPTVVVVDNCETVLPDPGDDPAAADEADDVSAGILALCRQLLAADPDTRMVFTSREPLPSPFARRDHDWELGALSRDDAVELVGQVMTQHGWTPPVTDPGATPQEITDLVEAVNGHPRALVLLAGEIAERGVRATTGDLRTLMAELDRAHPGERENSLYASVALSLRRLPAATRRHVEALACCHGGVHLAVIGLLTGLDNDGANRLAVELIGVGLGEDLGHGHLRLDPGLAPYLRTQHTPADLDALQNRWADATTQLALYLYEERFQDTQYAAALTVLELPNLLALLDWLPDHRPPDQVVDLATRMEGLLERLGRPRALARAVRVREHAAGQLTGWNRARHEAASAEIDRLWQRGDFPAALAATQQLLEQHRAAGETAYPSADYDTAATFARLGRVLSMGGAAQAALTPLAEAHRRFQHLADTGREAAASMAAVTVTDIGDCLRTLGRWDEAADAYQDAIERSTQLGDHRGAAVSKGQLATIRLLQRRYPEALDGHAQARATFEALGEPPMVAVSWHQTGRVHQEAGQFDAAEDAYRRALAIEVREADLPGQARTLDALGVLYAALGRLEESVTFHRQATDIWIRVQDRAAEGRARNNLAIGLLALGRHDEARQELQRALDCLPDYGHAVQPWKAWTILANLETATGHPDAAHAAHQQAITTYLAYRRDGGQSTSNLIDIFSAATQAIVASRPGELARELDQLIGPDTPPQPAAALRAVLAVLAGTRDPTLADDPDLHPIAAAELLLLLDILQEPSRSPG
jgi:tetratricopeptide (TPR) repeat protein